MSSLPSVDPDDQQQGEPSETFQDARKITIPVNPARLAWGKYDHGRNRDVGEGDIHGSYSADTIASAGKIRKSFRWQAQMMVAVSLSRLGGIEQAEAYQLIPQNAFSGTTMSYGEKIGTAENAEAARSDPNGFYHGMTVKQGQEVFVLSGPPVVFAADESPVRPDGSASADGGNIKPVLTADAWSPELAGKGPNHMSRTRSNHPALGAEECCSLDIHE